MANAKITKPINLALQGGGAHGAFTWGVLDKLLEDDRVEIRAISGTSAGAMNAVVLADGLEEGGIEGARSQLKKFWSEISIVARASPIRRAPLDVFTGNWNLDLNPSLMLVDLMQLFASPYQLNPWNINPLKDIIERLVDFERVRKSADKMPVYVSATNVKTGFVEVFPPDKITVEMVMASAALPFLYQAVEIGDSAYWDGGYMGNPPLFPLFGQGGTDDLVIVQINPIVRNEVPRTARDIMNRINEISFNSSLIAEFRAIEFVRKLVKEGAVDTSHYRAIRVHRIDGQEKLRALGASSKVNAEWAFLEHLFGIGRDCAERWLDKCWTKVGEEATVNLDEMFKDSSDN
jgi:NTE family protein